MYYYEFKDKDAYVSAKNFMIGLTKTEPVDFPRD